MAANDTAIPLDADASLGDESIERPKRKRRPKAAIAPDDESPIVFGSTSPRLFIAEPTNDPESEADDEDGHASSAPAPRRARRRPRPAHATQPPTAADDGALTSEAGASGKTKTSSKSRARLSNLPVEVTGVVVFALGLLLLFSLVSYSSRDTAAGHTGPVGNWIGPGGAILADFSTLLLGLCADLLPFVMFGIAVACFRPLEQPRRPVLRGSAALIASLGAVSLLHLLLRGTKVLPFPAGGLMGAVLADAGARALAPLGAGLVALALFVTGTVTALDRPLGPVLRGLCEHLWALVRGSRDRLDVWREERRLLREEEERLRREIEAEESPVTAPKFGSD